ncbi:hypothetical protein LF1_55730 [Rubripirellula obstinata]|uniref:Uncharacterized protein n=1 Tax=Rubripirellula obstinata TaxID=406547 RepID=A0A5B1CCP7_9BACT|nr:hypothetical protein LF1_55730 [Rubripirellula obstinata]
MNTNSTKSPRTPRGIRLLLRCALCGPVLYVGSFFAFRMFRTYPFSLAPADTPEHNLVVFSRNPKAQEFATAFYRPLILLTPSNCHYPTAAEMARLNDAFPSK